MMHVVRRPPLGPQPLPEATEPPAQASPASWWMDGDVAAILVVFWIASVVRVVGAAMHHEVFGAEASLAFMSVLAVPWALGRAVLRRRRRADVATQSPPREGGAKRPVLRLVQK
jgi:hypothetical protein